MDTVLKLCAEKVISGLSEHENQRFAGKTILVTGAAGFLGCHFLHYFLRLNDQNIVSKNCKLIAVDNFSRGVPNWLVAFEGRPDIQVLKTDITSDYLNFDADFIIHAASIASPTYYRIHPIETMDANVIGLRKILDYAVVNKSVESILYFSTSEIYGDPSPENIPTPETYRGNVSCTGPRACYDESKRYGETLCVAFANVHKVPVKVARPFNNYGPGLKITDKRVIPDFFRDVLSNRDIVMLSKGNDTRTFCFITDAITGYLKILLSDKNGEAYNIGVEGPEITMHELATKIFEVTKRTDLKVTYKVSEDKDYLVDNPKRRCPDISKARADLLYSPSVSLSEGLELTHRYYLANPDGSES